jgi:hypothetical protein
MELRFSSLRMHFQHRNVAFYAVPFWEYGVSYNDAVRLFWTGEEPALSRPLARGDYFFLAMSQIWSEWIFKPMFVKL